MGLIERCGYFGLFCLLMYPAASQQRREVRRGTLEDELKIDGRHIDIIAERVIDEHDNVHDYPSPGGGTSYVPNVYDHEPASFTNFDYDSFEQKRSHRPSSKSNNAELELFQQQRPPASNQQQEAHRQQSRPMSENDRFERPVNFISPPNDGGGQPISYLLSIFQLPKEYQTPPPGPLQGGFIGQPQQPTPPLPPRIVDMATGVDPSTHRQTDRKARSRSVRKHRSKNRKVKPSVIIVKKIIPLSTTTYK